MNYPEIPESCRILTPASPECFRSSPLPVSGISFSENSNVRQLFKRAALLSGAIETQPRKQIILFALQFQPSTLVLNSKVIHVLLRASAVNPVVFEPPKMSSTISLSSVSILIKNAGSSDGNLAGWRSMPSSLHIRR